MSQSILKLENITKIYDNGVLANDKVNLDVKKGEIHAIVGENGAGKSTLMKMIFGLEHPSSGEILVRDKKVEIQDVNHAIHLGIGMVHQHFMLIPSFTVTQNVMLGMEPKKGLAIDYAAADSKVKEFAEKYNFRLNPTDKVQDISIGMKQKVEIIKALIRGAEILILDEPTAVLTPQETEELFQQLKLLKADGHTIIFISHKLREVKEISDRVTIIRKGETKGVHETASVSVQQISSLMVGRDVVLAYEKQPVELGKKVLQVKNLSTIAPEGKTSLKELNFSVHQGEILGIAGVEGNGQNELIEIITGNSKSYTGDVFVKEKELRRTTIKGLRDNRCSYIPEDRMSVGIAGDASIEDNFISNRYEDPELFKGLFMNKKKIQAVSEELIAEYRVSAKSTLQLVEHLSGGNIQKVVVGRECSVEPDVLIAEQPTRGVDLGAAELIHKKMITMRDEKVGIILVSADISEAMEVSDRLIVMYGGEIVALIKEPSKISEKELGEYMLGIKKQAPEQLLEAIK